MLQFAPATRGEAKARVAILGPTGAGKTWTALEWAEVLADGGNVAVIDTENASASLYADRFSFQTAAWWPPYDPGKVAAAIKDAARNYDVLVLDSLTHFWAGDGGVLDIVDKEASRMRGNSYAAWKKGTPLWRGILDALVFAPCHVVVTMRSKMDHVITEDDRGRKSVEKLGMAPQARNDVEYEFTVVGEMDHSHRLSITKSRAADLADKVAAPHQAGGLAHELRDWLSSATGEHAQPPEPDDLAANDDGEPMMTDPQKKKLFALQGEHGITDRDDRIAYCSDVIGRTIESSSDLTKADAMKIIDELEQHAVEQMPPLPDEEAPADE